MLVWVWRFDALQKAPNSTQITTTITNYALFWDTIIISSMNTERTWKCGYDPCPTFGAESLGKASTFNMKPAVTCYVHFVLNDQCQPTSSWRPMKNSDSGSPPTSLHCLTWPTSIYWLFHPRLELDEVAAISWKCTMEFSLSSSRRFSSFLLLIPRHTVPILFNLAWVHSPD